MVLKDNEKCYFISIVIPTYNRKRLLYECVTSLLCVDYPSDLYEIIVIDDGSSDDPFSLLNNLSLADKKKVRCISNQVHQGVSVARNKGFRLAKGEILACVDDDCRVEKKWLKEIARTFNEYPLASAVGGCVLNVTDTSFAWASYILEFSNWFPSNKIHVTKNIPTCNIAYRKRSIIGYTFPEEYTEARFEDALFNYKLTSIGKKIIFNPHIKCVHNRWGRGFKQEQYYKDQKRYALAFVKGGYEVFGIWGKILIKIQVLNLLCLRLFLVLFRCLRSRVYFYKFVQNFRLIFMGEWMRNKYIYDYLTLSKTTKTLE